MPENKLIFKDLGRISYKLAWEYQEKLFNEIISRKKDPKAQPTQTGTEIPGYLLFCEHPHVYTMGKSGSMDNLLINENDLREKGVQFFKIDRGGDITYHGPGQIVGYPIIDLESFGIGVKQYVGRLEEAVIITLEEFGVKAGRLDGATGVWIERDDPQKARKICAIGVRTSRWVTMHGFAFNINTDLKYYQYINPCGFLDKGVTSLHKEINNKTDMELVKEILKNRLISALTR